MTYTKSTEVWSVDAPGVRGDESPWGTSRMAPDRLLAASLNQRLVRVYDEVDEVRILNITETAAAREKQEEIAERFSRWVWEDDTWAARLVGTYNTLFRDSSAPRHHAFRRR